MARKRQTTALPKANPKKTTEVNEPAQPQTLRDRLMNRKPSDEYKTRAEREAEIQRFVIIGTAAAVALIAVVLVLAFVVDGLIRPNQAVASVSNTNISAADFRERVRIERAINIYRLNEAANDFISFTGADVNAAFEQLLQQNPYSTWYNELTVPDQMGLRVLDDMIADQVVRDYAAANNITVSDEDIDEQINNFIGYDPERIAAIGTEPTPTQTPTTAPTAVVSPTPSPTVPPTEVPATAEATSEAGTAEATVDATVEGAQPTFTPVSPTAVPTESREEAEQRYGDARQEFIRIVTSDANVSEGRLREFFRIQALREKVSEQLSGADAESTTSTFVNARHILVGTEEEAQDVLTALENGDSFAELARTLSTDEGSGANGGELGDSPVYQFVKPFADAVRTAPLGETVGPVETDFGFHIIQVTSREERELTEVQQDQARQVTLGNWLEEQVDPAVTPNEKFSNWPEFVPQNPVFVYRPR